MRAPLLAGLVLLGLAALLHVSTLTVPVPSSPDLSYAPPPAMAAGPSADVVVPQDVATSLNAFGVDLLSRLASTAQSSENVFVSPLSVASALAMAAAGAVADTAVSAAFTAVLRGDLASGGSAQLRALATPSDGNLTLASANSLWARDGIKRSYGELLTERFGAVAAPLTDAAAVNGWVSEHTAGKITTIVDDGIVKDPLVRALIVNAVYFKAPWSTPFEPRLTKRGEFHVTAGGPGEPCAMMSLKPQRLPFARTSAGTAVALSYGNGQYRAVLVLPAARDEASMAALLAGAPASPSALSELRSQLGDARVKLSLPRFTLSYGVASLKQALVAMGLGPAFDASSGEFGLITDDKDLHISDVLHKAVLEVTEEGTTAAAATAVVMMTRAVMIEPPPQVMVFDRPFLMIIEDAASGAPLFVGRISRPEFTAVPAEGGGGGPSSAPAPQFGREFVPHDE